MLALLSHAVCITFSTEPEQRGESSEILAPQLPKSTIVCAVHSNDTSTPPVTDVYCNLHSVKLNCIAGNFPRFKLL